jgi:hypothetical protein
MDEPDVKLTKRGRPDKRTEKDGTSRQNGSQAHSKINALVQAGNLVREEESGSDLEIIIQKRALVPKRPTPMPEPKLERSSSPNDEKYTGLMNDLATLGKEMVDLRTVKPEPVAQAPDPVATLRRQILMRF